MHVTTSKLHQQGALKKIERKKPYLLYIFVNKKKDLNIFLEHNWHKNVSHYDEPINFNCENTKKYQRVWIKWWNTSQKYYFKANVRL